MPMQRHLYPANWGAIAHQIKTEANWRCQNCDRPCRKPGVTFEAFAEWLLHNEDLDWWDEAFDEICNEGSGEAVVVPRKQRFTLTVAHLNHVPPDCRPENLRAWCAPCHARHDLAAMALKRRLKAERLGQMSLFIGD